MQINNLDKFSKEEKNLIAFITSLYKEGREVSFGLDEINNFYEGKKAFSDILDIIKTVRDKKLEKVEGKKKEYVDIINEIEIDAENEKIKLGLSDKFLNIMMEIV